MAKNRQPIAKRCRALGISPAVMGYSGKSSFRNPNGNSRRKKSEYSLQLTEKQKVKFIYGIMEKQFRAYYEKAEKAQGKTGSVLLTLIEHRLDNVVFRLGLASTRREARQLVNHAHFTVNGKKVNIPSYLVKVGDVIEVKESSVSTTRFKAIAENNSTVAPKWLEKASNNLGGKVIAEPERDDIDFPVEEHLIVELYSK
ncbi:MAG: 30S ribosomal protein S4 [Ruminococcus sp.]|nr:30S ribosomal protein S4 [Ruminococcus sp.]